jgi:hypothetical protein
VIGCLGFPTDEPSENPLPQQHFTNDFSSKGGGQMSEKAVFVRASNLDDIIFAIKTLQAIGTHL